MDERVVKSSRSRCANLGQAAGASVNPVYTPRAIANRRALTRDRTLFGVDSAPLIRKPALGPPCACARVGSRKPRVQPSFAISRRESRCVILTSGPSEPVPLPPFTWPPVRCEQAQHASYRTRSPRNPYRNRRLPFHREHFEHGSCPATPVPLSAFPIFLECSRLQMHPTYMVLPLPRTTIHPPRVGMSRNTTKKSKMSDYRAITLGLY